MTTPSAERSGYGVGWMLHVAWAVSYWMRLVGAVGEVTEAPRHGRDERRGAAPGFGGVDVRKVGSVGCARCPRCGIVRQGFDESGRWKPDSDSVGGLALEQVRSEVESDADAQDVGDQAWMTALSIEVAVVVAVEVEPGVGASGESWLRGSVPSEKELVEAIGTGSVDASINSRSWWLMRQKLRQRRPRTATAPWWGRPMPASARNGPVGLVPDRCGVGL